VDPQGYKLVVNTKEAERVRAIFALYREHESLLPVVEEVARRGGSASGGRRGRAASAAATHAVT
jgi:hypothetical protein